MQSRFLDFPRYSGLLLPVSALMLPLAGCSTLPSSGPTASQVVKRANDTRNEFQFAIVPLDSQAVESLNKAQAARSAAAATVASLAEPSKDAVLGPGDILNISIYEVGVSLFSAAAASPSGGFDPSAHGEKFPPLTVDEQGQIHLPYIGDMTVAGLTPGQVEKAVNARMAKTSQRPQALVTIEKNVSNTVYVTGDVNKPGRYDLTYNHERLLDAIAAASGASASSEDTLLRFERNGTVVEQRLDAIRAGSPDDIMLAPRDHIELVKRPRSFTVFGATGKVSQVSFETGAVTLAEALARAQGPLDSTADPTAIFIFRYDDAIDHPRGSKPIIYRLNLLDPASYFLAQRVAMQDKDVIYIANAAANQPSKLVAIINQLFSPIVTARYLAN